jgi:ATP-dependent Zn protease
MRDDFPEAMNVDFIEDSSPEFVYMYVEYDPS